MIPFFPASNSSDGSPQPAIVSEVDWTTGSQTGTVHVTPYTSTASIPAYPLGDGAFSPGDRVLIQTYASGSGTPPQTYILGRLGSTPTSSVLYYEMYSIPVFQCPAATTTRIMPSDIHGTSISPFSYPVTLPYNKNDGVFHPPIAGLYEITYYLNSGSAVMNNGSAVASADYYMDIQVNHNTTYADGNATPADMVASASSKTTASGQFSYTLNTQQVLIPNDSVWCELTILDGSCFVDGANLGGWAHAGSVSFTLLSSLF